MKENYKDETSGLRLREVDGKFQLGTKQENEPYLKNLIQEKNEKNLSKPALETLSIIAYKQPVTKLEVEELRGVNCDSTIKGLLDFDLIEISGKLDRIGHPNLYSTTEKFLQKFGMENLEELPDLKELEEESNWDYKNIWLIVELHREESAKNL